MHSTVLEIVCSMYTGHLIPTGYWIDTNWTQIMWTGWLSCCGQCLLWLWCPNPVCQFSNADTESRRNVVSYTLHLAALPLVSALLATTSCLGIILGWMSQPKKVLYWVIEEAFPHIVEMLDDVNSQVSRRLSTRQKKKGVSSK